MRGGGVLAMAIFWVIVQAVPAYGEYQSHGKRDPLVPLLTEDGQRIHPPGFDEEPLTQGVTHLVLQGVVFDPQAESYAVINGEIVRKNDTIGDVKVLKIEPAVVTVLADGQPQKLVVQPTTEETQTHP